MRIAVCLSGQPRTWEKCYLRWKEILEPQGNVDFFFHLWDYNTLPNLLLSLNGGTSLHDEPLNSEEKNKIIETLNPKKFLFESKKTINYWNCDIQENYQFGPWTKEQFYSLYCVSLLKRQYELENDFRYDVVMRLRSDLWFVDDFNITLPEPNTLYSAHCSWDNVYNCYRVGDIFYYADSHTFDQMALFFKFLSFVPTTWIVSPDKCPPPEIAMYFYMMNIGVLNKPSHVSLKVKRDPRVLEIKGKLDQYEII